MISFDEYIKNPCGTLSIPYWKVKFIRLPDGMKIVLDRYFSKENLRKYTDEQYFRLYHNLENVQKPDLAGFGLKTAEFKDIDTIVSIINESYSDLKVNQPQIESYMKTPVYDANLWVLAIEKSTGKCVGSGIADYDNEAKELIIEWVQVLPDYRRRKIGQAIVNELLYRMPNTADFATVSGKKCNNTNPEALYRSCGFIGNDIWHILRRK